jgi:CubicO group peptidase (beta-lactamase class C family)
MVPYIPKVYDYFVEDHFNSLSWTLSPRSICNNSCESGFGWYTDVSADGERYIDHAGGGAGFSMIMRLYPDSNLGIAVLANSTDLDRDRLVELTKA